MRRSIASALALVAFCASAAADAATIEYTRDSLYSLIQAGTTSIERTGSFVEGPDVIGTIGDPNGPGPWGRVNHDGPGGTLNFTAEAKNGCCGDHATTGGHAHVTWQFEFRVLGSDATLWTTASRPGGPVPPYGWWYLTLVDLTSGASTNGGAVWNLVDGHYYRLDVLVASMTTPAGDYGYGVGTFGSTFTNAAFRRAAVPEPGSAAIFGAALCAALLASGMRYRPHAHLGTASQARRFAASGPADEARASTDEN